MNVHKNKGTWYPGVGSGGRRRETYVSNCIALVTTIGVGMLLLTNMRWFVGIKVEGNGKEGDAAGDVAHPKRGDTWQQGGVEQMPFGWREPGNRLDSTLVIYVYNAEDEEEERSFAYFLRYGVTENQPAYRIIIVDRPDVKAFPRLPSLPSNAKYLKTSLCTSTWGAIDGVSRQLPLNDYNYFVVVDSKVRGPFVPSYVSTKRDAMHWTEAFTDRIDDQVKMVGSIVSCEGAAKDGDAAGEWRGNPFVRPHAWATDLKGLAKMLAQDEIFKCHKNTWDVRYHSDSGASLAILQSGWTIDTLMSRYQGVDWRSTTSWQCNQRVPPEYEMHYDGISLNPYETIFVPVHSTSAAVQWSYVEQADRYEKWQDMHLRQGEALREIQNNAWIANHWHYKAEKLVSMNSRGPSCFDFDYYVEV